MWAQTTPHHITDHISGMEYLHSVVCIIKPIKCVISDKNCMAIACIINLKVMIHEAFLKKQSNFMCPHTLFSHARLHIRIAFLIPNA